MTTPNEVTGYKAALEGREADIQALAIALAPLVNKLHEEKKAHGGASRETERALAVKQSEMSAAQGELAQLQREVVELSNGYADIQDIKRSNAEILAKMKAGARTGLTPSSKATPDPREWAQIVAGNPGLKQILEGDTKSTGVMTLPWNAPRYYKDVDAVDLTGAPPNEQRHPEWVNTEREPLLLESLIPSFNVTSDTFKIVRQSQDYIVTTECAVAHSSASTYSVTNARGFEIGATVFSGDSETNSAVISSIAYGALPTSVDVITFTGATSFAASVGDRLWSKSAVPTAEAATFPYGEVVYANNSVIIERLGIIIPATLDALSDTPTLQNLLNNHVRNSLLVNSQKQILNGTGSNTEITGLLNISGINTYSWSAGTSGDTRLDALRRAKTTVTVDYFMPEVTLLSPTDKERVELTPGSDGHYVWAQIQGGDGVQRAWGTRVIESHSMATGTALVANLSLACVIGNRAGVQVFLSTEHADFFSRDMVAIKASRRFGLGVMRPNAICKVTFDSAPA